MTVGLFLNGDAQNRGFLKSPKPERKTPFSPVRFTTLKTTSLRPRPRVSCRFTRMSHLNRARVLRSVHSSGTGPGQPARRGLHQRPASAQPHPTQDRGDGPPRDPALRHLATAARVPRLRVQDPVPLPGDRLHQARGHRRQQAQGETLVTVIMIMIIIMIKIIRIIRKK